jgi:pteridine reductase
VAVHYNRSAEGAQETADAIRSAGGAAEVFGADLSNPQEATRLVDTVADRFGGLDLLVNSAGIMQRTPIGSVTPAQWDETFAINVRGPFFASQAAAARMRGRGGVIINVADLAGLEAWSAYVPHSVSKAALIHLTRCLAHALAPGIRVNAVAPGPVLLPEHWNASSADHLIATTPLHRLGSPEDVVQAVLYLIQAEYVTGEVLVVDGGRHVRT